MNIIDLRVRALCVRLSCAAGELVLHGPYECELQGASPSSSVEGGTLVTLHMTVHAKGGIVLGPRFITWRGNGSRNNRART